MNALSRLFWLLCILTIAHFAYIQVFILPTVLADSGGYVMLDTAITGYTAVEAKAFFQAIQASGNTSFAAFHAFDDRVFPMLYGLTLALALWIITDGWSKAIRIILVLVALTASVADYLENAKIIAMLEMDAAKIPKSLADAASTTTITKYTLIGISVGIIIVILTQRLIVNSMSKNKTKVDNG
ncbi:MAG: hypothetical protein L3J33_07635 [Rhodobacteraceae bacterium]|nr:hypothetical protein [Paracoccaceae bacterium]